MGELSTIHFEISKTERTYTGVELRPHFLLQELHVKGSAIGVFVGPCNVKTEHLVDWEDRLAQDRIEARSMIHFMGEFFGMSLNEGVLTQRFLMSLIGEILSEDFGVKYRRRGDDIYVGEGKLSVSIVTASPVSILLHTGINVDPTGTPVKAAGLAQIGVAPEKLISRVKERFLEEWADMKWACTKVRPVV